MRRVLLGVYLLALLASHVVRWFQIDLDPRPRQQTVMLHEVDGHVTTGRLIGLSYVDSHPGPDDGEETLPVVFLLHGSPAASSFMMALHRELAEDPAIRTITPDLPGFEGSTIDIADYSVEAHARYLGPLMDSLGIDAAHFVGYSMSGGVVLQASDQMPDRVESIVMLSAIGVQELELTGDYLLNHSVHALQLAGLWLLREGVPHFGWMDDVILGVPYARNFYDTDQRPLRGILRAYAGPMLIIHGTDDFLVPVEAALEHRRIVPQSRLELIEGGGHGLVVSAPARMARLITGFIADVERGVAPVRSDAEPARIAAAEPPFDASSLPRATGGQLIALLILIAGATLVSEDLASIGAGLMAARGTIGLEHAMFAAFAGILIGDVGLYLAGRLLGRRIVRMPPFSWMIDERQLARAASWFSDRGGRVIIASRFIPGTRFPTYVAAGTLKAPFWLFLAYFVGASLLWVPIIVGGGMLVGNELLEYYAVYEAYAVWVMIAALVLIYAVVHTLLPLSTHVGRRGMLSRWRRIRHWEFWPPWAFYPPVVAYMLWLAVKQRSLTVFTAANPGIETGGFIGESKIRILEMAADASDDVARFMAVPPYGTDENPGVRTAAALAWMNEEKLSFPVVLKPDVGERGDGVLVAEDAAGIRTH
ncbi:MAG: alpha/beta fold hydrolase, partial [Rhodothermales bacterium]|nr:alpha/beta fold hydrolase [Rhodothermales bacterium]